jgi:hypothetical protein
MELAGLRESWEREEGLTGFFLLTGLFSPAIPTDPNFV